MSQGKIAIKNSNFQSNSANSGIGWGAIVQFSSESSSNLEIKNSTFTENSGVSLIFFDNTQLLSSLTTTECSFTKNTGRSLHLVYTSWNDKKSKFIQNQSKDGGAAAFLENRSIGNLEDTTCTKNMSRNGGAIIIRSSSKLIGLRLILN